MPYNYYLAAKRIAKQIDAFGHHDTSKEIVNAIDEGFSSTEILMKIRFIFNNFIKKTDISLDVQKKIVSLINKIDVALN